MHDMITFSQIMTVMDCYRYSELGAWMEKDCKDTIVMSTCCGWLSKNRDFWTDKVDQMEAQMIEGAKVDG